MATIRSSIELQDNFTSVLYQVIDSVNMGMSAMEEMSRTMNAPVDVSAMRDSLAQASAALTEYGAAARGEISEGTQAQREMNEELERGAGRAHSLMNAVKGMVGAYATVRTISSVVDISDNLAQTTARLNLIVDDGGSVDELDAKIMASAQRSRASYFDTANAVAKMGLNARDAFSGTDEIIGFMEQINKQFVINGASTQEQNAAMLQLTQAMASGVLRGDELRAVTEQAPGIIQNIADYLDVTTGKVREMAAEGEITAAVVKNAMFAAADETNAKFESMPATWGQVWQSMQNTALVAFRPVLRQINDIANSEDFQSFSNGLIQALSVAAAVATEVFGMMVGLGAAIADNWSWISPIIYGVIGALGMYITYLGITKMAEMASKAVKVISAIASYAHAAATRTEASATARATAAQYGLNTALLSSPITWIIVLIIALIALFYAVIGLINKIAGTSISATGIICGAFMVALAFVGNLFIALYNSIVDILALIINAIADVADFIGNVFTDPVGAVGRLFFDLADTVLGVLQTLASAIDDIFGSNLSGSVQGWRDSLGGWVDDTFGKGTEIMAKVNADDFKFKRFEYSEAWDAGYNFGAGIEESVKKFDPSNLFNTEVPSAADYASGIQGIGDGVGDISGNTKDIANSLEITKEELKYLRDIAEREVVNRITAANINVNMTNNNTISEDSDLDTIVERLRSKVEEEMNATAEGVH